MSVESLKKTRGSLRTATSKLFTKFETEFTQKEPSLENLEILSEQLIDKEKALYELDREIEKLILDENIEKEIETRESYKESIILWKTRARRLLNASKQTYVVEQSQERVLVENSCVQQQSVHLPKLSIQKFDGNPSKFLEFWQSFENAIHNNKALCDVDKFNYLKSLLSGSALNVVSGFALTNENYSSAISLLKERFGRQDVLQNVHMLNLLKIPPLKFSNDLNGLKNLYDKCEIEIRSLEALGIPKENFGVLLCPLLIQKIPPDLALEYNRSRDEENWSLDDLMKFIGKELICRERVNFAGRLENRNKNFPSPNSANKFHDGNKMNFNRNFNKQSASTSEFVALTENKCIFCNVEGDHSWQNCNVVSIDKKKEILKKEGRCFRCLKRNHLYKYCRSNIKCSVCQKPHSEAICFKKFNVPQISNNTEHESSNESLASTIVSPISGQRERGVTVSLQTGSIEVHGQRKIGKIRCLYDTGAEKTFISRQVVKELNLPVVGEETILIHAFQSSNPNQQKCRKVKLSIKSKINGKTIIIYALETDEITRATLKYPEENIREYLNFEGIELSDQQNNNNLEGSKISLLMGADNYFRIVTGKIKRINSSLVCVETHAGWVLCGSNSDTRINDGPFIGVCNTVVLKALTEDETSLRKFWELDAIGITDGLINSRTVSDDEAMHIFESSLKFENHRYEVSLPWKYENVDLPDNFYNAKRRLDSLNKRFRRDPILYCEYKAVIEDYISTNIIEEVKEPQAIDSKVRPIYYLPQSPVIKKDRETTKLRIVNDASSHIPNSPSLNDLLHPGPNLNPDLLNLIIQFRLNPIAIVCDIKQAFLNISLREEDRDAVRFLWNEQPDDEQELKVFRFTRVLFGVTSSPFLLAAVIKKHISKYEEEHPDAFEALNKSLYVDDLLSGSTSVEDAFKLSKEAKDIMMEASMTLRKWKTNSPILKDMWKRAEFDIASSEENCDGNIEIKVLGLSWNTVLDVFKFDVSHLKQFVDEAKKTKRTVIRASGRIFDPAGFLTPFTVRVKILFQQLWIRKIDWDQQLPQDLTTIWDDWCKELPNLNLIEIPRYYFAELELPSKKIEVHCFTDASEKSYGGVVYVRYNDSNQPKVSFVSSKTRVAPLRKSETQLSIPRLELMAALIGARLTKHLSPVFEKFEVTYYYWTDSSITYYWIRSNYEKFKPFVGNRIKEIQALSDPKAWSHCPGHENPADLLSRGLTSSKLKDNRLWWNGPAWLSQSKEEWPKTLKEDFQETRESKEIELRKNISVNLTNIENDDTDENFPVQKYSSFSKTCRIMAWCLRFINNCRNTLENRNKNYLKTSELKNATLKLIEIVQSQEFKKEIKCLKNNKPLPNNSKILSLNAFLDKDGLLRVGGRLEFSNLSYDQKHQLLLPKSHHLTKLIIEHYHILSLHAGTQTTLSLIRQKYWIPSGRDRVQRVLSKCMTCFRTKNRTLNQLMSNLPKNRIVPSRPFSKVGVDFAGPIIAKPNMKRSRVKLKHYIALFICFCTKAVHLEIVSDLTTEAFLASLKRFIARRSVPLEIYSDNATNFTGARNILNKLCQNEQIQKFSLEKEITWHFIPPLAPNFGGIWEANIKTMKKHLIKTTQGSILNYEELNTLVVQIEACLNSRPLTVISADSTDLQPLTPGHFLVGGPLLSTPVEDPSPNITLKSRWALLQDLRNRFWRRWSKEYLNELQQRKKWAQKSPNLERGQIVIMKEKDLPPQKWKLGRILETFPGHDGLVRVVLLKTAAGNLKRAVSSLCPLPFNDVELRSTGGGVFGTDTNNPQAKT